MAPEPGAPGARRTKPQLSELEDRLGYAFRDGALAGLALTHLSAQASGGRSYQRLEFLGDRVLGVVVAERLYSAFPHASEGELSMRLAKLVRRETCADIAVEWQVGPHVVLGLGEARAGGRKKIAILSDVCESLIGAVFVDGGFEAARELILRAWGDRLTADAEPERDAKTAVQEWAQARALAAPALRGSRPQRPGSRADFRHAGRLAGLRTGGRRGALEARRRAGRRAGLPGPLGGDVTRAGFVALIGAPNAGKSTLINTLVGEKVSIVTRKAQTTRATVRGVTTKGEAQIVFVDTAGLFAPKRRLDRAMVASAWGAAADADVLALLVDAHRAATETEISEPMREILETLKASRKPRVLVLNKIDAIDREKLLAIAKRFNEALRFDETFMISALNRDGVDRLADALARMIPEGPWLYPEDQIAEAPIRSLAAEITREKLFERLHEELPYQATVETDSWKDLPDGSARVEQTVFVTRESHRKIVIGEGGRTIKAIGSAARRDIAEAHGANVHLFLHVKVREGWQDDPERYRAMGLEFPKG